MRRGDAHGDPAAQDGARRQGAWPDARTEQPRRLISGRDKGALVPLAVPASTSWAGSGDGAASRAARPGAPLPGETEAVAVPPAAGRALLHGQQVNEAGQARNETVDRERSQRLGLE